MFFGAISWLLKSLLTSVNPRQYDCSPDASQRTVNKRNAVVDRTRVNGNHSAEDNIHEVNWIKQQKSCAKLASRSFIWNERHTWNSVHVAVYTLYYHAARRSFSSYSGFGFPQRAAKLTTSFSNMGQSANIQQLILEGWRRNSSSPTTPVNRKFEGQTEAATKRELQITEAISRTILTTLQERKMQRSRKCIAGTVSTHASIDVNHLEATCQRCEELCGLRLFCGVCYA